MNNARALPFGLLFCLSGCAGSTPPDTTYYLLRGDPITDVQPAPAAVALGRVGVAGYLDQSGIVLETGNNEIEVARYHRWAEPLNQGIRSLLRDAIAQQLGFHVAARASDHLEYVVDIHIDQLHGTRLGEVFMVAEVHIQHEGGTLDTFRVATTRRMDRDGYAALVEAEKALLDELGRTIADRLEQALGA